jgi:hypothetical protein
MREQYALKSPAADRRQQKKGQSRSQNYQCPLRFHKWFNLASESSGGKEKVPARGTIAMIGKMM